ncbi:hypothetical protein B4U79_11546 [Dinothrombium tinctorium]|uniref:Serine/threonine-protein kinase ATR n=1 Tax=Dinothrombium tinctorium TaxID=1965070 RepID=A0A3S3PB87_9ACAR|nr:hypothetical protein B4U79_14614 [Dinothrombium tinctorium]RWS05054.1 hypothetical protein B4U79_11546 [Dinothrombium tinctorium]
MYESILSNLQKVVTTALLVLATNDCPSFATFAKDLHTILMQIAAKFTEKSEHVCYEPAVLCSKAEELRKDKDFSKAIMSKHAIHLKFSSLEEMQIVFVAICDVIKSVFEPFKLFFDDNSCADSKIMKLLKAINKTQSICLKKHAIDIFLTATPAYQFNLTCGLDFLNCLLSCTFKFLDGQDASVQMEDILMRGWELIEQKSKMIHETTSIFFTIDSEMNILLHFIEAFNSILEKVNLKNCDNILFQHSIPRTIHTIFEHISSEKPVVRYSSSLFELFLRKISKQRLIKSHWILLLKRIIVKQFLSAVEWNGSDPTIYPSSLSSSFKDTTQSQISSSLSNSPLSLSRNTSIGNMQSNRDINSPSIKDIVSNEENCDSESDDSDEERENNAKDSKIHNLLEELWSYFTSETAKHQNFSVMTNLYSLICELSIFYNNWGISKDCEKIINIDQLYQLANSYRNSLLNMLDSNEIDEVLYLILNFIKLCHFTGQDTKVSEWASIFISLLESEKLSFKYGEILPSKYFNFENFLKTSKAGSEALILCLEALTYFDNELDPVKRFHCFLKLFTKTKSVTAYSLFLVDLMPLFLLQQQSILSTQVLKELLEAPDTFRSLYIGTLCCYFSGCSRTDWKYGNDFYFTGKVVVCECSKTRESLTKASFEKARAQMTLRSEELKLLCDAFLSCLQSGKTDSRQLSFLLHYSAKKFFIHIGIDELIMKAFMETLTLDINELRHPMLQVLPFFTNPFSDGLIFGYDFFKLLNCFKEIFGRKQKELHAFSNNELIFIVKFGSFCEGELLIEIIIYLIRRCWEKSFVKHQLEQLAKYKNKELIDLFRCYKPQLLKKLLEFIMNEHSDPKVQFEYLKLSLFAFVNGFDEETDAEARNSLYKEALPLIIPSVLIESSNRSKLLLTTIAENTHILTRSVNVSYLIDVHFTPILTFFIQNLTIDEMHSSLQYVEDLFGGNIQELFKEKAPSLRKQAFYRYHSCREPAVFLLSTIYYYENGKRIDLNDRKSFNIYFVDHMREYFHTLTNDLISLGKKSFSEKISEIKEALESLVDIINSLGPQNIPTIETNLKAALRTPLKYDFSREDREFAEILIEAWKAFVQNHNSLGSEIIEISNNLLPLVEISPKSTEKVFEVFIDENKKEFHQYLSELNFLPKKKELYKILEVIKKVKKAKENAQGELRKRIEEIIDHLSVENLDVKVIRLQNLRDLLRENRDFLQQFRIPRKEEPTDPLIRKLVMILTDSCAPHENLRLVIAECLGEIGAIDPGRFEIKDFVTKSSPITEHYCVDDPEFARKLLNELSSILDSEEESRIHDCVYYAMQETLKVYNVKIGDSFWQQLSSQLQNRCSTLFQSHYHVQKNYLESKLSVPIYNIDLDYKDWIFQWIIKLTSIIKSEKARNIFSSCLTTVQYNCKFARFLLPYVLVYAISDASADEKEEVIRGEINAIMKSATSDLTDIESFTHVITSPMESKITISTTQLLEVQHLCVQTLFSVLDSFHYSHYRRKNSPQTSALHPVSSFLNTLSKYDLSSLAYSSQSYARALSYMEQHIKDRINPKEAAFGENVKKLQKFYVALDDVDGVEGVIAKSNCNNSLMDTILAHEVKGQLQDVLSCCEKGTKNEPKNIEYVKTLLRCYMSLDQPSTALAVILGFISNEHEWKNQLFPYMIEASWKLCNWEQLESMLKAQETEEYNFTISVGIGKLFLHAKNRNKDLFNETLSKLRQKEMNPYAAAAMENGAYIRGYPHLIRLHMISDLENGLKQLFEIGEKATSQSMKAMLKDWHSRNNVVQASLRFQEPILNLQRIMLQIGDSDSTFLEERTRSWLSSAKIARKSGNFQRAYNCLFEAENCIAPAPNVPIALQSQILCEKGKYYWAKGDQESKEIAVRELSRGIDKLFLDIKEEDNEELKLAYVKVKLLHTKYAEQTSILQSTDLVTAYKETTQFGCNWEEPFFRLAKYYERLLGTMEKPEQKADAMQRTFQQFGESIRCGAKHVYESVPGLLSVWFDLGSLCIAEPTKSSRRASKDSLSKVVEACDKVHAILDSLLDKIPSYVLLTAFSQLISRICHPYPKLRDKLSDLISRLISEYPKQTIWMILGVYNNDTNNLRKKQCEKIICAAFEHNKEIQQFWHKMSELSTLLLKLSFHKTGDKEKSLNIYSISTLKNLKDFFDKSPQILLPYQSFMKVQMPSKPNKFNKEHSPFPDYVFIQKIEQTAMVLPSLQKPKKITFLGSNGKHYFMICKAQDDLRKDQRTMEFMNLINLHLKKDRETRKRELSIRTYTVIPLNHECGLVEWVEDLTSIRGIVANLYNEKGVTFNDIRTVYPDNKLKLDDRISKFKKFVMPKVSPPVFSEFFLRTFRNPTTWYMSRLAYVRSCAVMSIVGYIIGLGDRHLENILINIVYGNLVHVDFNVLFDKGRALAYPEVVPFRLTHNMIDAMGATGYEGPFRKTCEATLRVMREQSDALMSVLKPFVYDPLLEWKTIDKSEKQRHRGRSSINDADLVEIFNEQAQICLNQIEDRLKGNLTMDNKPMGLPVSVSGQVSYLIGEATNVKNLAQMYIGWASFY